MISFTHYINKRFILLFLMSVVNLLFMHHQFLHTVALEIECFKTSYIDNLLACLLDASTIYLLAWLITAGRTRISLAIAFLFTLTWSFCNVFYSRFFHQYLSWSSIGQAGNLTDSIVTESMMSGFKIIDLYYPLMAVLFFWMLFRSKGKDVKSRSISTMAVLWSCLLAIGLAAHSLYMFHPSIGFVYELEKTLFTPAKMNSMWPNWTVFHKGFVRKMIIEPLTGEGKMKLTPEQMAKIEKEYTDHSQRVTVRTAPEHVKNVIFILVESYLSATSDLVVDGKEITPHLNRLKHDSACYYNGHLQPDVFIGESSDGQLIYMAGLLPLHSEISVSKVRNNRIIGLPEQLKKKYPALTSYTIIPTNPTLWDQQAMTNAYGFDKLYSMIDYQAEMKDNDSGGFLTDKMIFAYAAKKDEGNRPPFCTLLLTMSMHMPYDKHIEHDFVIHDNSLPQAYKNYLTDCHYTDMHLGNYLQELKAKGLYDNSLIVIASDHDAHPDYLDMKDKISREIPLYIINGGIDKEKAWDGRCHQLDVYTTIIDIMGIESRWRGLGHTLLTKDYHNSVTPQIQELSDWINYGDYFKNMKP